MPFCDKLWKDNFIDKYSLIIIDKYSSIQCLMYTILPKKYIVLTIRSNSSPIFVLIVILI